MLRIKLSRAARAALVVGVSGMLAFSAIGCGGNKTRGGGDGGGRSTRADRGGGGGGGGARRQQVSEDEQARLNEARKAAEDTERQLSELRLERIRLEQEAAGAGQ